jgi:hydrogenase maturation protein HypF
MHKRQNPMYKLLFEGIVQGVGFRPTIYRVAKKLGICGYVLNKGAEVEVVIDKDPQIFIKEVKNHLPSIARISKITIQRHKGDFNDFSILKSSNGTKHSLVPYDTAICDDCLKELFNTSNRRNRFPFTNCTICGARFSLIKDVPYDRERTSMKDFSLCSKCKVEYDDPLNRRYHAQTISCPKCGPSYQLYDKDGKKIVKENILQFFADSIDKGQIGVIKSWGGMHLCCRVDKINQFREWYKRPQKSFAIMVKDISTARKYAEIDDFEEKLLLSNKRPIVLLKKRKAEDVSPGLDSIGLFLPYTGIHHLLFSYLKSDALIMTSANIPGEPMIIDDKTVFSLDADVYLLHNRDIPNRVDDTVIKPWNKHNFFLRKSRGFVPDPLIIDYNKKILCVGAGENIVGALSTNKLLYSTQYIGNSKYYTTLEFLKDSLKHLMSLSMQKNKLDAVAMDLHPGYDSRQVAKYFSEKFNTSLFEIQHHWAHAASLLLDNNIDDAVVLTIDGLGYGYDKTFWGGEVLYSDFNDFTRIGHLEEIPLIGGDKATLDPRRLVFAIFNKYGKEKYFKGREADILSKIIPNSPVSTSIGRVLDALACYLGICEKRTYDGEPAMKLERYLTMGKSSYSFDLTAKNNVIQTCDLFNQIDEEIKNPINDRIKADVSYSFVKTIVDALSDIAINYAIDNDITRIGVTGGVSYNIPIIEMIEEKILENKLEFIVHNNVCNGDGGIAIGQNVIAANML